MSKYDDILNEKQNEGKMYKHYTQDERSIKYLRPRKRNQNMRSLQDGSTTLSEDNYIEIKNKKTSVSLDSDTSIL